MAQSLDTTSATNPCLQTPTSRIARTARDPSTVNLVFVHGLCGNGIESWSSATHPVETILHLAPICATVSIFDHDMRLDEQMSWEDFLAKRSSLLEFVYDIYSDKKTTPLILIGHALGGLLIKEMLWAIRQQPHRFHDFLETISGIIFVATPHITKSDQASLESFSRILKADLKSVTKKTINKRDMSYLAFPGMRFEEVGMQIAILSIFETQETRLRGPVFRTKSYVLVPRESVRTKADKEELVELASELSLVFDGSDNALVHRCMADFISRTTLEGHLRLQKVFEPSVVDGFQRPSVRPKLSLSSSMRQQTGSSSDAFTPRSSFTPNSPSARTDNSPKNSFTTEGSYEIIKPTRPALWPPHSLWPCLIFNQHLRNPNFHGRENVLKLLADHLLPTSTTPQNSSSKKPLKTFVIYGLGGMGKTQIAAEFAHRYKAQFDAIFLINADDTDKLDFSFGQIAERLGFLTDASSKSPQISRDFVKTWLETPVKTMPFSTTESDPFIQHTKPASWLIVFDNVDDPYHLYDYWPHDGQGSVLVTSKDPKIKSVSYIGDAGIELDVFSSDEAAALLRRLVRRDVIPASDELSIKIVERLYRFPLAVAATAGMIWRQEMSFDEFLQIYDNENALAPLYRLRDTLQRYPHSLISSWGLENLGEGAGAILNVVSLLDPNGIQQDILTRQPELAYAIGLPQDLKSYLEDLSSLTQSSLLTRNSETKELSLHRMVQEVNIVRIMSIPDLLENIFNSAIRLLSALWPYVTVASPPGYAQYTRKDRWPQCEKIYVHIQRMKQNFEDYDLSKRKLVSLRDFLLLLSELSWYQLERAMVAGSIASANLCLEICEESNEDFRDIVAAVHGTQNQLSFETNNPESCLFHAQQALSIMQELSLERKERPQKLAVALGEMGKACSRNDLPQRALGYYAESRTIRESLPGFHKLALFTSILGRGHALWLLGKHEEASRCLIEVLQNQEEAFGPDDKESMRTGLALFALGNRALRQYQSTIGEGHLRFGEFDLARLFFEKALKVYRNEKYYEPEIARTCFQLGITLTNLGDDQDALKYLQRAQLMLAHIVPNNQRPYDELEIGDFDRLICFWGR
ncbi:hypothetical protein MMC17_008109 [Xylographa soralifera]|nr:hypothetical protein [Xylographa soralifera]